MERFANTRRRLHDRPRDQSQDPRSLPSSSGGILPQNEQISDVDRNQQDGVNEVQDRLAPHDAM